MRERQRQVNRYVRAVGSYLPCAGKHKKQLLTALLLWVAALCVSLYDYHQAYNGWSETSIIEGPSPYGQ